MKFKEIVAHISRIFPKAESKLNDDSNLEDITNFLGTIESVESTLTESTLIKDIQSNIDNLKTAIESVEQSMVTKETLENIETKMHKSTGDLLVKQIKKIKSHFGKEFNSIKAVIANIKETTQNGNDGVEIKSQNKKKTEEFDVDAMVNAELVDELFN